jgi:hypothetical protein
MNKRYVKIFAIISFASLIFSGCKKEIADGSRITAEIQSDSKWEHDNGCRLVKVSNIFGASTYKYNKKGLVDEWYTTGYGGTFKHAYGFDGKLRKSKFYFEGAFLYSITFSYKNDHVVTEVWYDDNAKVKIDEVYYTYDKHGRMSRMDSKIGNYYTLYKRTEDGSLKEWKYFLGGKPQAKAVYTYLKHKKNPTSATPGLEYGYPYVNGTYDQNKWYSTSEDYTTYDASGKGTLLQLQDPHKTKFRINAENYVTAADYWDLIPTPAYFHFDFEYENCKDCGPKNWSLEPASTLRAGPPDNKIALQLMRPTVKAALGIK